MTRRTLTTLALTAALGLAAASPAAAIEEVIPPNGVDDDPTTTIGRPSNAEMRSAISFVYGLMAEASRAKITTGPIRPYGRIWRAAVIRIDGPGLHLRLRVKMTEQPDGYEIFSTPLDAA